MPYIFGKFGNRHPVIILLPTCFILLWIAHSALRTSRASSYDRDMTRHQSNLFSYEFDDVDDLETNLNKIEDWLSKYNIPAANALQPGLSRDEIDRLLKPLSIEVPEELYILYGWHNGQRGDQDVELIPAFRFLPLEEAIDTYSTLKKISWRYSFLGGIFQKSIGDNNAVDAAEHFPILMLNGEDFYMVLCGGPKSGSVISYLLESADYPESAYPSISSLAYEVVENFQGRGYFINEDGIYSINTDEYLKIFRKHHPSTESPEEYNRSIREERTRKQDGGETLTSVLGSGVTKISTFDAQKRLIKKELYRNGKLFKEISDSHDEEGRIRKRISTYTDIIGKVAASTSSWTYNKDGSITISEDFGDGRFINTTVSKTHNGEWRILEKTD